MHDVMHTQLHCGELLRGRQFALEAKRSCGRGLKMCRRGA